MLLQEEGSAWGWLQFFPAAPLLRGPGRLPRHFLVSITKPHRLPGQPPASTRSLPTLPCRRVAPGSTLFLPVQVAGALLSMGDAHTAQVGKHSMPAMTTCSQTCSRGQAGRLIGACPSSAARTASMPRHLAAKTPPKTTWLPFAPAGRLGAGWHGRGDQREWQVQAHPAQEGGPAAIPQGDRCVVWKVSGFLSRQWRQTGRCLMAACGPPAATSLLASSRWPCQLRACTTRPTYYSNYPAACLWRFHARHLWPSPCPLRRCRIWTSLSSRMTPTTWSRQAGLAGMHRYGSQDGERTRPLLCVLHPAPTAPSPAQKRPDSLLHLACLSTAAFLCRATPRRTG